LRCDGRTKFSKLPIFTTPAAIPDISWELKEAGHDIPTKTGTFSTAPLQLLTRIGLALLEPVRNILDILEPRHTRQIWPNETLALLSYSFSIFRWRREILYLNPRLGVELKILERLHHWRLRLLLAEVDDNRWYSSRLVAALYLNIMYEGIGSMEPSHLVDNSAKELLQSALEKRIAYLYCISLSNDTAMDEFQFQSNDSVTVGLLNLFRSTFRLLPPECHICRAEVLEDVALGTQRVPSGTKWGSVIDETLIRQKHPQPFEGPYPNLLAYVPARFLAAFGFDAEVICRLGQDINDPRHHLLGVTERLLEELVTIGGAPLPQELLLATPIALSLGAQIVVDELATREYHGDREFEIMCLIITTSAAAFNDFVSYRRAQLNAEKGMSSQKHSPGFHDHAHLGWRDWLDSDDENHDVGTGVTPRREPIRVCSGHEK